MNVDTSELDPLSASMAQSFATTMSMMPPEAIRFLCKLCAQELESRGEPVDD